MTRLLRVTCAAVLLMAASAWAADVDAGVAGPLPTDAFARIEPGMGEQQVLSVVGLPGAEGLYRPRRSGLWMVFGRGAAQRTYFYRGLGRVLFEGGNPLLRNGTVTRVEIDPNEAGTAP